MVGGLKQQIQCGRVLLGSFSLSWELPVPGNSGWSVSCLDGSCVNCVAHRVRKDPYMKKTTLTELGRQVSYSKKRLGDLKTENPRGAHRGILGDVYAGHNLDI